MADNVVRDFGRPVHGTTKNIASAKTSGSLIAFPLTQTFNNPVALLSKDAGVSEDGVACFLGNVVVRYACLSTDTGDPGKVMYHDATNDRLTTDPQVALVDTHNRAGRLAKTKASGETTADIYLNMP